uniref:Uncharacterized protein n=1 Tax=Plectus sambesii TaxID=2011161 RepID=A0A914VI61_9BILA
MVSSKKCFFESLDIGLEKGWTSSGLSTAGLRVSSHRLNKITLVVSGASTAIPSSRRRRLSLFTTSLQLRAATASSKRSLIAGIPIGRERRPLPTTFGATAAAAAVRAAPAQSRQSYAPTTGQPESRWRVGSRHGALTSVAETA